MILTLLFYNAWGPAPQPAKLPARPPALLSPVIASLFNSTIILNVVTLLV